MSIFSDQIIVAADAATSGNKTNLTTALKEILDDYSDEVMHTVEDILQQVGEDSAEKLKTSASTIGGFKDRTGKYRKSWKVTTEKHRTFTATVVHAKGPEYRRTHLLEYGHLKRNSSDRTKEFPHIYTVNEDAQEKAIRLITEAIERR